MTPFISTPKRVVDKKTLNVLKASSLPLMCVLNARSLYNKVDNFKTFIKELGIEFAIISETWERADFSLEELVNLSNYKIKSFKRPKVIQNRQPGGGSAIVYSENRFTTKP